MERRRTGRRPDIGNVKLYPDRKLTAADKKGYYLRFYCPLKRKRVRRMCGTRNRRDARQIAKECQRRLIDGSYLASSGVITQQLEANEVGMVALVPVNETIPSWSEAVDRYCKKLRKRNREKSLADTISRLGIVQRVCAKHLSLAGEDGQLQLAQCMTLDVFDALEVALLDGVESSKPERSANTVNGIMRATMAFARYCKKRKWIAEIPAWELMSVDDVMKGRPLTLAEFNQMIDVVPMVVGDGSAQSWIFVLQVLWQSAFRVQDVMEFSWNDPNFIHPKWPMRRGQHPTIFIPPAQKNGKTQEIPMLPGLAELLNSIPGDDRHGWIVNPRPLEYTLKSQSNWFKPTLQQLAELVPKYANTSIANACGVSDKTVAKWLTQYDLKRTKPVAHFGEQIPSSVRYRLRVGATTKHSQPKLGGDRITHQRVSRVICMIGEAAGIVVKTPLPGSISKPKYASAHDLRRSVAQRLINDGVSAETLKVVMRHRDFKTTEKFYGAQREAQSAAQEIRQRANSSGQNSELVGHFVGHSDDSEGLSESDIKKIKLLLANV